MNIVLLGAPGSGKGTQAEFIAKEYGLHYFQAGKLARELAEKDPRIGKIINSGKLIPEGLMTSYATRNLEANYNDGENIIFDGYPRFVTQFQELSRWLLERGKKVDTVISLDVSEEEAVKRISSRRTCKACGRIYSLNINLPEGGRCGCGGELLQREDDYPEAIKVRFEYYRENTKKLIDYADEKGFLIRINGENSIEQVKKDIKSEIEKLVNRS